MTHMYGICLSEFGAMLAKVILCNFKYSGRNHVFIAFVLCKKVLTKLWM